MKKDIFIDAQIANTFAGHPNLENEYLDLITWLTTNNANPNENAHLVVSKDLRQEYLGGNQHCNHKFSIANIYFQLQKENRLHLIKSEDMEAFENRYFTQVIWKNLKCKGNQSKDPNHIKIILLSHRRLALIKDENLLNDLLGFPKFGKTCIAKRSIDNEFNYKSYAPDFRPIRLK